MPRCEDMTRREKVGKEVIRITKGVMGLDENVPPRPLSPAWWAQQVTGSEQPQLQGF